MDVFIADIRLPRYRQATPSRDQEVQNGRLDLEAHHELG